eukprot:654989-Amphidinium_carterae.2
MPQLAKDLRQGNLLSDRKGSCTLPRPDWLRAMGPGMFAAQPLNAGNIRLTSILLGAPLLHELDRQRGCAH